jgi:hypothetical protein
MMTENIRSRWTSTTPSIDARMAKVCDNIKVANIQALHNAGDRRRRDTAQGCSTNSSMDLDVQQSSQFNSVFSSIAQNLANLHLANLRITQ